MRSDNPDDVVVENPNDVVVDAADAVTLNQDVEWERCERLAAPASRGALDNLRLLSRAFAPEHVSGHARADPSLTDSGPYAGPLVRRFLGVMVAIAAVEVSVGLALLPWTWGELHRQLGGTGEYLTTLLVGHTATAGLLLIGGRTDRRTRLLAGYFLLQTAFAPLFIWYAYFWETPPLERFDSVLLDLPPLARLSGYLYLFPQMYAPAFLWAFARESPRIHRRSRLDDLARRMVPVSVATGVCYWVACMVTYASADYWPGAFLVANYVAVVATQLSALAAVGVIALRARTATGDEARRFVLFSGAFLLYEGLTFLYDIPSTSATSIWGPERHSSALLPITALLRFPGLLLLWYSVLAVRVPHPREVVRAFYRRLLLRRRLLAGLAAAAALAMGWLVASRPERSVGAFVTDPLVLSLGAACGALLLLVSGREHILLRLDSWVVPETTDQRQALAAATGALAQSGRIEEVSREVTRTINRSCGSPARLLVAGEVETETRNFKMRDAALAPLARASSIVHMLERAGGAVRVHPSDPTSVFELLPPDEAAWVVETGADAVVAVVGPGAEVIGVLAVGRRFDDRIVRSVDIPFLEALAAAAGLAIARLRSLRVPAAGSLDGPPARECPRCGCLAVAAETRGCDCGSEYTEAEAPALLAGKYRLMRRLGSGGMGTAYAARDMQLQRDVAVKTLSGLSVARLMALRSEGWAMATVTHPALAQIYAIESWRGRPFLVVEFLAGGTLADRLRRGPLEPPGAVAIAAALAEAVAALHAAECLHRDIKPSNIGFTSTGSPKLLDFGLAGATDDTAVTGGTPRYASPEVLSGSPAGESDDVWSLCVVLYEMVSGSHPFADAGSDQVADRILRQRIAAPVPAGAAAEPPSAAEGFAASVLTAERASRPATARAFAEALKGIPGQGGSHQSPSREMPRA